MWFILIWLNWLSFTALCLILTVSFIQLAINVCMRSLVFCSLAWLRIVEADLSSGTIYLVLSSLSSACLWSIPHFVAWFLWRVPNFSISSVFWLSSMQLEIENSYIFSSFNFIPISRFAMLEWFCNLVAYRISCD